MPTTLTKTLTLNQVPRHTPVTIQADVQCPIKDDDGGDGMEFTTTCYIHAVHTHINCIELEARA